MRPVSKAAGQPAGWVSCLVFGGWPSHPSYPSLATEWDVPGARCQVPEILPATDGTERRGREGGVGVASEGYTGWIGGSGPGAGAAAVVVVVVVGAVLSCLVYQPNTLRYGVSKFCSRSDFGFLSLVGLVGAVAVLSCLLTIYLVHCGNEFRNSAPEIFPFGPWFGLWVFKPCWLCRLLNHRRRGWRHVMPPSRAPLEGIPSCPTHARRELSRRPRLLGLSG